MATKRPLRKQSRSTKSRPLDAELFELAEKVGKVFDLPEAAEARARLAKEALNYRDQYRPHGTEDIWATKTKWTAFLLRLILKCPRILSRPPDFAWVLDDLEWILIRRNWDPNYDRDYWNAVDRVRKTLRTGHPRDKALDYFRFRMVQDIMSPPGGLRDLVDMCGKEEALRRAADMEEQLLGKRPHERVVRRSCDRVKQDLDDLNQLLRGDHPQGAAVTNSSPYIQKSQLQSSCRNESDVPPTHDG